MANTYRTLIETHELAALLEEDGAVVFDCRHTLADPQLGERLYRESHIPRAYFLHLDRDLSGPTDGKNGRHPLPDPHRVAALFGNFGVGKDTQVIVYDQGSSLMSGRAWWTLKWLGHEAVAVLNGGFARWTAEGRLVTAQLPPAPKRALLDPRLSMRAVDAAYVLTHLRRPEMTLVDARANDRFRGENEATDPVAGHIPGALNRPYAMNLGPDGRFKSTDELSAEFQELLAGRDPATVVHQCGSGVSACHNILAMTLAGIDQGRTLYPGSWSEWCSDPSRPIETGSVSPKPASQP